MRRLGFLLLMSCLSGGACAHVTRWKNYNNLRFAYHVCYPDWLSAAPVSGSGDGRAFTDKSGGEMRVWSNYAAMVLVNGKEEPSDEALPGKVIGQAADYEERDLSHVTHRSVRDDRYALSGTKKGKIVYLKTIVPDDRWIMLQIIYPAAAAPKWKPIIPRIASCLKAFPPMQFDSVNKK